MGRPTKYSPAYCNEVIQHMADGASLTSFAAEIGVARSTINEWASEYPEFSEACARAKAKCAAWWEKANRVLAVTGEGCQGAIALGLKNMASDEWKERQNVELTGKDGKAIEIEQRKREDAEFVSSAITGLAARARPPGVAEQP